MKTIWLTLTLLISTTVKAQAQTALNCRFFDKKEKLLVEGKSDAESAQFQGEGFELLMGIEEDGYLYAFVYQLKDLAGVELTLIPVAGLEAYLEDLPTGEISYLPQEGTYQGYQLHCRVEK